MFSLKTISLLALAGSTIATPAPHRRPGGNVVWTTVYHTVIQTVDPGFVVPENTPAPKPSSTPAGYGYQPVTTTVVVAPKPTTTKVVISSSSSKVVYNPPTTTSSKSSSASSPAATPSTPASGGSDSGYMSTVNEWRAKLGLSDLAHSDKLESNACDTAAAGNGEMVHSLGDGTFAQVLAPGAADEFYDCFVGGWLCEIPDMDGMDGVCDTFGGYWKHDSTGHADILTSTDYSKIGCCNKGGIWDCDLA